MESWNLLCRRAKQLLRGCRQIDFFWLIFHSDVNGHPALLRLKNQIRSAGHWDTFCLRAESYRYGLIGDIFATIN